MFCRMERSSRPHPLVGNQPTSTFIHRAADELMQLISLLLLPGREEQEVRSVPGRTIPSHTSWCVMPFRGEMAFQGHRPCLGVSKIWWSVLMENQKASLFMRGTDIKEGVTPHPLQPCPRCSCCKSSLSPITWPKGHPFLIGKEQTCGKNSQPSYPNPLKKEMRKSERR